MSGRSSIEFSHSFNDINASVNQTHALLRSINAFRQTFNDINNLIKKPTLVNFFWTAVQLIRTYRTIRRLMKLAAIGSSKAASVVGIAAAMAEPDIGPEPVIPETVMSFAPMEVSIEAFKENTPMKLESLDLSMIPEQSRGAVQRILEDDAQITVEDAYMMLESQVKVWTGNLGNSIQWQPQTNGVRIFADAYYAYWVERGHDTFPGYWYMNYAFNNARMRLPLKIRAELNNIINNNG